MTRQEHLVLLVMEEASEVTQEASKVLRFGPDEIYPLINKKNSQRLREEINDFRVVVDMLTETGFFDRTTLREEAGKEKRNKVEWHINHSKKLGIIGEDIISQG